MRSLWLFPVPGFLLCVAGVFLARHGQVDAGVAVILAGIILAALMKVVVDVLIEQEPAS